MITKCPVCGSNCIDDIDEEKGACYCIKCNSTFNKYIIKERLSNEKDFCKD